MKFLAPAWLALLLLAAPILLLHMRRRRHVQVSSLILWQGVAGSPRPSHALHRPPFSAALLLQLLAVLIAALVLARPVPISSSAEHLILLLDAGANQDEARFAESTAAAQRLLRSVAAKDNATWSLLLVTDRPRPVAARWPADSSSLADLRPQLTPSAGVANWAQAAVLAQRLAEDDALGAAAGTARVVLIGPTAAGLEEARALLPDVEVVPVEGGPSEVFAWARAVPDLAESQVRVSGELVGLAVPEGESRVVSLGISFSPSTGGADQAGRVDVALTATAEGGSAGRFDLTVAVESDGILTLAVGESDVSFVLHEQAVTASVLYLGPGDEPLLRALGALPYVVLERLPATASLPEDAADYDLVIIDRVTVEHAPATSTWWLGSARVSNELAPERLEHEAVTLWESHGPATEVDWTSMAFGAAWVPTALPGATHLVNGERGPIMQLRHLADGFELRSSFELAASDWPSRNSFPLFVRDLVMMVEPAAGQLTEDSCQVGFVCQLPAGTVSILDPGDVDVPLARWAYPDAEVVASDFMPEQQGVYLLTDRRGRQRPLAVNAFQSALVPALGAADVGAATSDLPFNLRRALLLALALVILAEAFFAAQSGRAYRVPLLAARAAVLLLVGLAVLELRLPLPAHSGQLVIVEPAGTTTDESPNLGAIHLRTDSTFTDLGASLDLAAALVTPGTPARLIVSGDGSETRGDLATAAARAGSRGLTLDAFTSEPTPELDVSVRTVTTPAVVLAGDRFELNAVMHATSATTASVSTFRDGDLVSERQVALEMGDNRLSSELTERLAGTYLYEVEVQAPGDRTPANDRHGAKVSVAPAARAVLVAENLEWAHVLEAAFDTQGVDVMTMMPDAFPTHLKELEPYGAVILMNVPALALSMEQQLLLEEAVHERGLPLLLLGGENAFGPGGYYETPLERLSPTSSLVPREAPELAIAFVLDRSNSMRQYAGNAVRLDIAKVAALRSHELLPEGARSTLIVFDSTARTLVPLGLAADDAAFRAAIEELEPRGGTNLYPALVEAYEQLSDAGSAAAHVIVMSDGLSLPGDFDGIVGLLREKNITVSTIAIGPEADADQLREVARLGGGTFHSSVNFDALPSIMAHEVLLQSGELTEERDTNPAWHDRRAAFLRAWPDELPPVSGFVPTSLKPSATLHLSVTDDKGEVMPLLSSWHHGAGEVVAFTAHGAGPWTSAWLAESDYPLLWSHLVRQIARAPSDGPPGISLERRGDVLTVEGGVPVLFMEHETGSTILHTREVSAGRYVATAILSEVGWYEVSSADSGVGGRPAAFATQYVPYHAVLDRGLADPGRLAAAARASGGVVLTDLSQVGSVAQWHWARSPAWPYFTLAALILLLVELTGRYAPDLLAIRTRAISTRKDRS